MNAVLVPKTEPRWQRRKDARPAELLGAALAVFTERGFAGARLDDIAARAGVSKGTLYLYYENKEELFKATVREHVLPSVAAAENLARTEGVSAAQLVERLLRGWFVRMGEAKISAIPKLIISEAGNFPELARFYDAEVMARFRKAHRMILERGIASGEFRALPIEEAMMITAAPMFLMPLWRHAILQHLNQPPLVDAQKFLETHIDMTLAALRSQRAGSLMSARISPTLAAPQAAAKKLPARASRTHAPGLTLSKATSKAKPKATRR